MVQKMDSNDHCRACLSVVNSQNNYYNLFETPELVGKFSACTTLQPMLDDKLPDVLCTECYNKVLDFKKFQDMCLASDKHLQISYTADEGATFDNEKPIYDLEAQTVVAITVTENSVLLAEKKVNNQETKVKRRRGRPVKRRKLIANLEKKTETVEDVKQSEGIVQNVCNKQEKTTTNTETSQQNVDRLSDLIVADIQSPLKEKYLSQNPLRQLKTVKRNKYRDETENNNLSTVYKCDLCPTRFFVKHRLDAHKRSHEGLVPYPCTQSGCDRGFNRRHCLMEHLKEHEGNTSWFACDQAGCSKIYKHKPTLTMHLRTYHKLGAEIKSQICEICGKVFKTTAILKDHRYTHRDKSELPHACNEPQCMRRFSTKEKLKVHMMRHAGIKNFVCPYCGIRKTTRNELKIHINYHTLERTFSCRFCTKVCNSAGNLRTHVRTVHELARDYACRYCERSFGKPYTRKYHEMTHTGEKPHECTECGKRFTQPAALRTHRKIHNRQRDDANKIIETTPQLK